MHVASNNLVVKWMQVDACHFHHVAKSSNQQCFNLSLSEPQKPNELNGLVQVPKFANGSVWIWFGLGVQGSSLFN